LKLTLVRAATRCAFCHDELGRERRRCERCHVELHADCGTERCPTLGCRTQIPQRTMPTESSASDPMELAAQGCLTALLAPSAVLVLALVAALWPLTILLMTAAFTVYALAGAPAIAAMAGRFEATKERGMLVALALELPLLMGVMALWKWESSAFTPIVLLGGTFGPPAIGLLAAFLANRERKDLFQRR
jgi:hypothetical protein